MQKKIELTSTKRGVFLFIAMISFLQIVMGFCLVTTPTVKENDNINNINMNINFNENNNIANKLENKNKTIINNITLTQLSKK